MALDGSTVEDLLGFIPIDVAPDKTEANQPKRDLLSRLLRRPITSNGPVFFEHAPRELPTGWEKKTFRFEGLDIPYHIARAVEERAVSASGSGLKPDHAVDKKSVKADKKHGISKIWLNLPNPERGTNYMNFYKRLLHYFYTNQNSPFHTEFPSDLPRSIHGHSTGGAIALDLVTADETKAQYKIFKLVELEATFLDNANAAEHDPLWRQALFNVYARLPGHKIKIPNETTLGLGYNNYYALSKKAPGFKPVAHDTSDFGFSVARFSYNASFTLYLATQTIKERLAQIVTDPAPGFLNKTLSNYFMAAHNRLEILIEAAGLPSPHKLNPSENPSAFETPTFGQILETRNFGRKVKRRIVSDPNIESAAPILMVAGQFDHFSSLRPQKDVSKKLGAAFYISETGEHKPLSDDKKARKASIAMKKALMPGVSKLPKEIRKQESEASQDYFPEYSRAQIVRQSFTQAFQRVAKAMPRLARLHARQARRTLSESAHTPP